MLYPRHPMNQMRPMRPPVNFGNHYGFQPPRMQGGMPRMQGGIPRMQGVMPGMQGRPGGLGGLLKRLIPGMGNTNPMQGMGGMPGFLNSTGMQGMNSGTLKNLANPSNLSAIMGNVQKTLKMAESVVPMVQQYGPLMKNIPSMIKMYNAIKNADFDESEENEKEEDETISLSEVTPDGEDVEKIDEKAKTSGTGKSVPKLYI
ncbi:VrrA/YqfQ family protein [Bacillus nitroreducens]